MRTIDVVNPAPKTEFERWRQNNEFFYSKLRSYLPSRTVIKVKEEQ